MKITDVVQALESFAPRSWQESWDNSGMQVGDGAQPLEGVLLTLDVTMEAVDEAIRVGANLIVSHHPLLFTGLKSVAEQNNEARIVARAIREGVAIYSCHTNVDSAPGGINDTLARRIVGLEDVRPLVEGAEPNVGMGAIGRLPATGLTLAELAARLKERLGLQVLRMSQWGDPNRSVTRVAVCGGSGGSLIDDALREGAELLITGDLKYGDFQRTKGTLLLIDVGHWEGENHVLEIFYDVISKKMPNFAGRITRFNSNHVTYYL